MKKISYILLISPFLLTGCRSEVVVPDVIVTPTKAPVGLFLAYDAQGPAQNLITLGESQNGTFYYSLDKNTWTTTPPTAKDWGKYTIYWYCKNDSSVTNPGSRENPNTVLSIIKRELVPYEDLLPPTLGIISGIRQSDPYLNLQEEPIWFIDESFYEGSNFYFSKNGTDWSTNLPTVTYEEVKNAIPEGETYAEFATYMYFDGGTSIFLNIGSKDEPIVQYMYMYLDN